MKELPDSSEVFCINICVYPESPGVLSAIQPIVNVSVHCLHEIWKLIESIVAHWISHFWRISKGA